MNSLVFFRAAPSAIFDGIDIAALLIWLVRPNSSDLGNVFVSKYSSVTNSTDTSRLQDPYEFSPFSYNFITLSLHHFITSSLHHFITSSLHHFVTLSLHHFITLSLHHFITSSLHHFITSSLHHFITLSLCHFITSSLHRSFNEAPM